MRTAFLLISLLFASSALCKTIDMKIETKWTDKSKTTLTGTNVKTEIGKEWTIPLEARKDLVIKVKTSPYKMKLSGEEGLLITSTIEYIGEGKNVIISRPKVVTAFGKEALITMSAEKENLEIKLLPTKL